MGDKEHPVSFVDYYMTEYDKAVADGMSEYVAAQSILLNIEQSIINAIEKIEAGKGYEIKWRWKEQ